MTMIFRAKDVAESDEEAPKGGGKKKLSPEMQALWAKFMDEVYQGGAAEVDNPNRDGRQQKVKVNTALKDKRFQEKVRKQFKEWLAKQDEQPSPPTEKKKKEEPSPPQSQTIKKGILTPKGWNPDSEILSQAKSLFEEYSKDEKIAASIADLSTKMDEDLSDPQSSSLDWEKQPKGIKALYKNAQEASKYFAENLLSKSERQAWNRVLDSWQANSGGLGPQELMGAMADLGVEGEAAPYDNTKTRKKGAKSKTLKKAIAKAMAFTKMMYDQLGVSEITLYRGASNVPQGEPGQDVKVQNAREITSFSMEPSLAAQFVQEQKGGRLLQYKVPVERLFISPLTFGRFNQPCCGGGTENEYVVAGLTGLEGKIVDDKQKKFASTKPTSLRGALIRLAYERPSIRRDLLPLLMGREIV